MKIRVDTHTGGQIRDPIALFILEHLSTISKQSIHLDVEGLPPTVNHMYHHTRYGTRLTKEAKAFRDTVGNRSRIVQDRFQPQGVTFALILFFSPLWLTKKRELRKMDCDNRVKPLVDAVALGMGFEDMTIWGFYASKVLADISKTRIYLFDLGDVVPYYLTNHGR